METGRSTVLSLPPPGRFFPVEWALAPVTPQIVPRSSVEVYRKPAVDYVSPFDRKQVMSERGYYSRYKPWGDIHRKREVGGVRFRIIESVVNPIL